MPPPSTGLDGSRSIIFSPPLGRREADAPSSPRIVWVDPDRHATFAGEQALLAHGFRVDRVRDVAAAERDLAREPADLVILETALQDGNGMEVCRRLATDDAPPILVHSASDTLHDRVFALECGADDVFAKSGHLLEFLARVRVLVRRLSRPGRRPPQVWRLDLETRCVTGPSGRIVQLAPGEVALLEVLARRPGEILSRESVVAVLHGDHESLSRRSVDARVARLRRSLNRCEGGGMMIRSLRGRGYLFHAVVERADAARPRSRDFPDRVGLRRASR